MDKYINNDLYEYIEKTKNHDKKYNYYNAVNKKRVNDSKDWLKVLDNEVQEENMVLEIFEYMYNCKDYTSNGKNIAKFFDVDVAAINSYIKSFGKRVIKLLNLKEQIYDKKSSRRWNIPFETVPELNKDNIFTWKLRKELIDALIEKYDNYLPKDETINEKIERFVKENPYDKFCKKIKQDIATRDHFVNKFKINEIMNMKLEEYAFGRADVDQGGRDTFCYLLEERMQWLGDMRTRYPKKFGIWYLKGEHKYRWTTKYGENCDEAFKKIKQEICFLIACANNMDYEKIEECKIANLFKGKIISTYFPEKYLCIFNEDDVDRFLNILDIRYDMHEVNTLEKKKALLKDYKENNAILKNYSDYYFVVFLYNSFKNELKENKVISREIDYDFKFEKFKYIQSHEIKHKDGYRSKNTDYEKIYRNKKNTGNRGEVAVFQYEVNKLISLGMNDLAKQVRICENDAIGYDIESYDANGNEIHIEVKTNSRNTSYLDFYITDNELEHFTKDDNYYIYYLYNIQGKTKCHVIDKESMLSRKQEFFKPVIYKVSIDIEEE